MDPTARESPECCFVLRRPPHLSLIFALVLATQNYMGIIDTHDPLLLLWCSFCPLSSHNPPLSTQPSWKPQLLRVGIVDSHKWLHLPQILSTSKAETPQTLAIKTWHTIPVNLNSSELAEAQLQCQLFSIVSLPLKTSCSYSSHGSLGHLPHHSFSYSDPQPLLSLTCVHYTQDLNQVLSQRTTPWHAL